MIFFWKHIEIKKFCKKQNITRYKINKDGQLDVDQNVNLVINQSDKIPIKFNIVKGNFSILIRSDALYDIKLHNLPKKVVGSLTIEVKNLIVHYSERGKNIANFVSLEGSGLEEVTENFYCSNTSLQSLRGGPKKVGMSYDCSDNKLVNLDGCAYSIGGTLDCSNNYITSLRGCAEQIGGNLNCRENKLTSMIGCGKVNGSINCGDNKLETLKGCPNEINGILYCQNNNLKNFIGSPNVRYSIDNSFEYAIEASNNPILDLLGFPKVDTNGGTGIVNLFRCPVYKISILFPSQIEFFKSLDYNYLRGRNIIKSRFTEALSEIGKVPPISISGYHYI